MSHSASIALISSAESDKIVQKHPGIKAGDKIEGRVTSIDKNGRVLIDFGQFKASVEMNVPVKKGDLLRFIVVERGRQLKLKLQQYESTAKQQANSLITTGDLQQEKAIEELQAKINQLLQKDNTQAHIDDSKNLSKDLLKEINKELDHLKSHIQSQDQQDSIPKELKEDIKNLLNKLNQTLKKIPEDNSAQSSQKLNTLLKSLNNLRLSLDSNQRTENIIENKEPLVKQISQLKSDLHNIRLDQNIQGDVEKIIAQLTESADKINQMTDSEQFPQLREIVKNDIKPNLAELREILNQQEVQNVNEKPLLEEVKIDIENLEKNIAFTLKETPPPSQEIDTLVKDAEKALKEIALSEKSTLDFQKNISSQLIKTREHIQALNQYNGLSPELKSDIESALNQTVQLLRIIPGDLYDQPETRELADKLFQSISLLRSQTESLRDINQIREQIIKQISQLKSQLDQSDIPVSKEIRTLINQLAEAGEKLSKLTRPDQIPDLQKIISQQVKPALDALDIAVKKEPAVEGTNKNIWLNNFTRNIENLQKNTTAIEKQIAQLPSIEPEAAAKEVSADVKKLLEFLDISKFSKLTEIKNDQSPVPRKPEISKPIEIAKQDISTDLKKINQYFQETQLNQDIPRLPPEIEGKTERLLQQVGDLLKTISDTPESLKKMESLANSLHGLRNHLENTQNFLEIKEQINKQINQLHQQLESLKLETGSKKELEEILVKLAQTEEKLQQLKQPDQMPELKHLIENEIKPYLKDIGNILEKEQPIALSENQQTIEKTKVQIENLQKEMDLAFDKIPEIPPEKIETLIKEIENSVNNFSPISPGTVNASPQFSESIQSIYDNIKSALRLLQANLQVSGNQLELPSEIRNIFQNLESGLKFSEIADNLTDQLAHLKNQIEDAKLPLEKVASEIIGKLEDMINHIKDLKSQQRMHELQFFVKNHLKPFLNTMGEFFNNSNLVGELENPQQLSHIKQTIQSLMTQANNTLSINTGPASELSQLAEFSERIMNMPQEVKNALNQSPAGQRVSENISDLAKNIESLLSQLSEKSLGTTIISETPTQDYNNRELTSNIRTLLSHLRSHFEPLDIGESALKLMPRLKSLVENSGIFFEKKIADIINKLTEASNQIKSVQSLEQLPEIKTIIENDLKPNLLQLKEYLNNEKMIQQLGDQKSLDSIRHSIEDLLSNITNQQSRAVEQQGQQNPIQAFSFHIPIKGEEKPAELKVFYNKNRKKESPEEVKISLFLEMDKVGEIRSDFFQLQEDLNITFYVKNKNIKEYFEDHLQEIDSALESLFENIFINVVVSSKRISGFDWGNNEEEVITDKAVNVKV